MNRIFYPVYLLLLICIGPNIWAGDTLTWNIVNGTIIIESTGYRIGSSSATLNSFTGTYVIKGSSTSSFVSVKSGSQDIILNNLNIDRGTTGYGVGISSSSDIHFKLVGKNYLKGARGLTINGTSGTQRVFISGDTLYATSTSYYPAIGPFQTNIRKIEIDNAYVIAQCSGTSAGIGYSYNPATLDSLVINSGVLSASSAGYYGYGANKIIINGGSVKGTSSNSVITSSGTEVYCVTIPHHGSLSIPVTSNAGSQTYTFPCFHENDDNFYIYLPNGSYKFSSGGLQYVATINGASLTAMLDSLNGDGNITLTGDLITVKDSSYTIGSQPYKYTGHRYNFSGTSTKYGVIFTGGSQDTVVLDNVNIRANNGAAFELNGGQNIPVILKGTNHLTSTSKAGLQKTSLNGLLSISGDTLIAIGGIYSAGIGGASRGIADSITIASGYIEATGGMWAAGIGGGDHAAGKHITISGGKVITSSTVDVNGYSGSGIGGGYPAGASDILINGGFIKATGLGANNAIGGFYGSSFTNIQITGGVVEAYSNANYTLPEGIQISGGTVFAQMTGTPDQVYNFAFDGGIITGGSVNFVGSDGISASVMKYNSNDAHPTNGISSDKLYRCMYKVPGVTDTARIDSIKINNIPWNCKDLYTDTEGLVYLWLPVTTESKVQIYVKGKTYLYTGEIVAYDNYVPADEANSIPEYGNYLWQIPVTINTPVNGTLKVSAGDAELTSGSYACYKSILSIDVTADNGYKLDSIMVNNVKALKDTSVALTKALNISAYIHIKKFPVTYTATNGSLSITNNGNAVISGTTADYGSILDISSTPENGYKLDSIMINGNKLDGHMYTVSDTANITAVFSLQEFMLTTASENGTIEVTSGNTKLISGTVIPYGTDIVITAIPTDGYRLDELLLNNVLFISGNTCKVEANINISAVFSLIPTDIPVPGPEEVKIYSMPGAIVVEGIAGSKIEVYRTNGQKITSTKLSSAKQYIPVPQSGIYIVNIRTNKVFIKKVLVLN